MMFKLIDINPFNISILVILVGLWLVSGMLGVSIIKEGGSWKWPLLIALPQFTQALFRLPLGKLSQILRSRKIPLLFAVSVMVISTIPLFVTINYSTLLVSSFGFGFFGATFGLQNQYWSENWNIRNVFITSGLLISVSYIGKYFGQIINYSIDIDKDNVIYVLASLVSLAFVIWVSYALFHKEKKETIMLDNKGSYAKQVSEYKLRHIMIFSTMIVFISIAINMVSQNEFVGVESSLLKVSLMTSTIIASLITSFILVRILHDRLINIIAESITMIGMIILSISVFTIHSKALSFIGLIIATSGAATYTMSMFGMMLHIDHKNSLLVLGIWLSAKSFSIASGQLIGGEVITYTLSTSKYLIIAAISLVAVSMLFGNIVYKYTKPAYDLIEELEHHENHDKNYSHWK